LNRIDRAFAALREEDRAALIPFVTAGDPDLACTREIVLALAGAGADVVELGVPHSEPIAEGPTIQASSERSLRGNTTLLRVLDLCRELRAETDTPLALMGYLNNFLAYGEERFVKDAGAAGVDGVIVADAPYEEAPILQGACDAKGLHRILMVAPTSTPYRVTHIASRSRGFVYCVSVTGVTGAREGLPRELRALVARVRAATATPVAVGFGIAGPEQAAEVARIADGVIVGSALVERIARAGDGREAVEEAREFASSLSRAISSARR
jgi:tryptophan synthase alpha chain